MLGPLVHLVKVGLGQNRVLGIKSGKEEESGMFECAVEVRSWSLGLNLEFCIWTASLLRNSDDAVTAAFRREVWGYIFYGCMLRDRRKWLQGPSKSKLYRKLHFYLKVNNQVPHYISNRLMLYVEKLVIHSEIHIHIHIYIKHVRMVCR